MWFCFISARSRLDWRNCAWVVLVFLSCWEWSVLVVDSHWDDDIQATRWVALTTRSPSHWDMRRPDAAGNAASVPGGFERVSLSLFLLSFAFDCCGCESALWCQNTVWSLTFQFLKSLPSYFFWAFSSPCIVTIRASYYFTSMFRIEGAPGFRCGHLLLVSE